MVCALNHRDNLEPASVKMNIYMYMVCIVIDKHDIKLSTGGTRINYAFVAEPKKFKYKYLAKLYK